MSGKSHCFPLVISEKTLFSFCSMKSCVVMEWTVTIIFSNASVKTKWMDDFGIPDCIAVSSHAIHLSPSKMAAVKAAIVLSVEVLSPPDCSSLFITGLALIKRLGPMWKIKPTRCTNFWNLFWKETLHVSDSSSVHHQELFTAHMQWYMSYRFADSLQPGSGWSSILILLKNCQQTCMTYTYNCVYSEKLLMMNRGTVQNM